MTRNKFRNGGRGIVQKLWKQILTAFEKHSARQSRNKCHGEPHFKSCPNKKVNDGDSYHPGMKKYFREYACFIGGGGNYEEAAIPSAIVIAPANAENAI